ncbi:MAG TPA: hypothetical protein VF017_09965 [Thermoanaerobaculia bacterium]|nr:hypothetical protein [Thermoanaerobaculia bacterium]
MSYTFRVVFEGVCAYVPEYPFFVKNGQCLKPQDKKIRSLTVLLPDLRRPGITLGSDAKNVSLPKLREPHFPLMQFRLGDLREGTTRRVDLVCRDISERDETGILSLRREQIRFHLDAENAATFSFASALPRNPKADDPKKPTLADLEELESLYWLPALDQIAKNNKAAQRVREDFMPSYRGPFPEGLIARVECSGGRLRTHEFNRLVNGEVAVWNFAPPADPSHFEWNRGIGNSLALEFFDVRGDVRIEIKRLANEVVERQVVLGFAPGASRPVLEVKISNREPELLFEEEGFSRLVLPDMDFQAFYEKLSEERDKVVLGELPVPHPAPESFFGIRDKPCAGAVMSL